MTDAFDELVKEVNDGIVAMREAKMELKLRTEELVAQMKADDRPRNWALCYMDLVCKTVDETTAQWAMEFFEQAWPTEQ